LLPKNPRLDPTPLELRIANEEEEECVGVLAKEAGVLSVRAHPAPTVAPTATPAERASELRKQAFEACGRGHWNECLARLDEAKTLDPAGESDPEVQAARRRAMSGLPPR